MEFLGDEKHSKKEADFADSAEAFKDAGYLLKEHDLIVDIDNIEKDKIRKIIDLFGIKTHTVWTDRGAHFYFKKPQGFKGSSKVCPLGFEVEYKHIKNTKHITVKRNGKMRPVENEGIREDLPDIFFTRKKLEPLLGLEESEGRNSSLFAHRMKIHDLSNWQSILRFINNYVFTSPLSEDEFQTISRDTKVDFENENEPEIANYILKKYKVVSYLGQLYWYQDGQYFHDEGRLKRLVFNEVGLKRTRYVDEILKQMEYRAPLIDHGKTFDIKLANGILREGRFIEVKYEEFTPYTINIPYHAEAEPVQIVNDYIGMLTGGDPDYKTRLLEILAHPLIVNKEFKRMLAKFFIFVGDGGNGKGTLLFIIRKILGYNNCAALSIKNMTDERYFTTLQNKLVNLGDDVQDEAIDHEQMKMLKNISTCDFVATRNLFQQSKNVELTISLIFTSNYILKSFEKGKSYKRRVDWLPMYSKPKKKDKNFIQNVTTPAALEYWMKLIVEGYMRIYQNEGFTDSKIVSDFNSAYHINNNTVLQYLSDFDVEYFLNKKTPEAYEEYEIWAEENGINVQSRKLFVQTISDVFQLEPLPKKINGRTSRVFQPSQQIVAE